MAAPTPPEVIERVLELHRDGQSLREIAAATGLHHSTVARTVARKTLGRIPATPRRRASAAVATQASGLSATRDGDGAELATAHTPLAAPARDGDGDGDDHEPPAVPLPSRLPGGNRRSRVLFGAPEVDDYFDPDDEEDDLARVDDQPRDRRDGMNGNGGRPPIVHDVPNLQEVEPPQDPHTIRVMLDVPLLHAGIWEALTASDGYDGTLADLITETFAEHFGECLGVRLVLARMPKKSEEGEDDHAGDATAAAADPS